MERKLKTKIFILTGLAIALLVCVIVAGFIIWHFKIKPIQEESEARIYQEQVDKLQEDVAKELNGNSFDNTKFNSSGPDGKKVIAGKDKG